MGGSEGKAYQQLVTDGTGTAKWEDRLAYEGTNWKDFVLDSSTTFPTKITGFTMPPVGDTVTVKVDGVESVETVKSGKGEGPSYSYIGSTDMAGMASGTEGWCIFCIDGTEEVYGLTNVPVTISLLVAEIHKIKYEYLPDDLLKSPYPIQIVNFDDFLYSFGFKDSVSTGGEGTYNFSLSKEKWDEFINYLNEFNNGALCLSGTLVVYGIGPNGGRPTFYSVETVFDSGNNVYARRYQLGVSYSEETETVTAVRSITNIKIS